MFLNGNVGEMNKHVVQLTGTRGVFYCAKAAKSKFIPKWEFRLVQHSEDKRKQNTTLLFLLKELLFVLNFLNSCFVIFSGSFYTTALLRYNLCAI